ncbi:hypothetical protein BGZ76_001407, partial [Entomortierella beljakovae]
GTPRDLIGVCHQRLISGCYKEAYVQLPIDLSSHIEDELTQWLQFNSSIRHFKESNLSKQSFFPDEVLIKSLDGSRDNDEKILRALSRRKYLKSSTIYKLIQLIKSKDPEVLSWVIYALGAQSVITEPSAIAMVTALQNENSDVRKAAADALGNQSTLSHSTTTALVTALQDEYWDIRKAAVNALGNQSTLSDSTTTALVTALQDKHYEVRKAAANVLGKQSTLSDSTTEALVTALQDKNSNVGSAAAKALGNQSTFSEYTIKLIGAHLCDTDYGFHQYDTLGARRVLLSVKDLTVNQIEILYRRGLYQYSCDHHVSLFIHENALQVYTEQGFDRSYELSTEVLDKIRSAFIEVQRSGGIQYISYE